jgi:hypothetical protein
MRSAPPTPGGEPPLPCPVHCARPTVFSRRTTRIDPYVALAEGEFFLLDGLGIVTLRAAEDFLIMHALNPGVVGAVRAAIEARLAAPGTNGRRPAPPAEWGFSDVPWPAGPTEL